MSTKPDPSEFVELCRDCGRDTPHRVGVELVTESGDPTTAPFSREPYRVSVCTVCGAEESVRMNGG
ncbi:hypothetical protein [Halogeometricum sp. CBA1124]|uniref:DUF7835 family putative zinc beta-ribbon protein n=1 Tax=Halogeometricum sp. CBA1124 TaxID=2668071 RepID=UPI0014298BF7|nr:hypothetical protein [Halogeometricum sp. CBA1124]MUV57761.1 hypothetical protein [Halogeometricum sp. CBA1124]